ncbi:MAG: hypothetical protein GX536_00145 [Actinobacteria bacterium]|nr:hypothetical protein [Actinomycetota bacterium]OPZ79862.1 MAG: hypothetical protein BWY79_00170 [Actinobacteria bacterium ADurb.Bin444]
MAGALNRLVGAFRSLVFNATAGVREERVIRYIMNEMRKGKPYDDIMQEHYVVNHTTPHMRARLVENPTIVRGIEDQLAGRRYAYTVDYAPVKKIEGRD